MCVCVCVYMCVTGFWKADWIATLGLIHFIGPANGYTSTLHIHSAITRLGWLVCFSIERVLPILWIHDWDNGTHGGHYMGGMGLKFIPGINHVWAYGWHFWDPWLVLTVLMVGLTYLRLPNHPLPFPPPPTPYNMPSMIFKQFCKSCSKSSSVSYVASRNT